MAQVLSPMFTYNDPVKMIQTRPSSSDTFSNNSSNQQTSQQSRMAQMPRNPHSSHGASTGYRGASAAPVSPYAFKTTPHLRYNDNRSTSASVVERSSAPLSADSAAGNRQRYPAAASVSTTSSSASSNGTANTGSTSGTWNQLPLFTKDDSILSSPFEIPAFTSESSSSPTSSENKTSSTPIGDVMAKPSPDRYRRTHRKSEGSVPSLQTSVAPENGAVSTPTSLPKMGQFTYTPQHFKGPQQRSAPPAAKQDVDKPSSPSTDSTNKPQSPAQSAKSPGAESLKRYRRKSSLNNVNSVEGVSPTTSNVTQSPTSDPESPVSTTSARPSSAHKDTRPSSAGSGARQPLTGLRNDTFSNANVPKKANTPSPLSRPMTAGDSPETSPGKNSSVVTPAVTPAAFQNSPAVAAMAALNDKESSKGMKSKLRRAFSFGSSAEMRRVNVDVDPAADRAKHRQEAFHSQLDEGLELDEEQSAIARQQEAAGLGHNIYSGQGNVFSGSTDNLSISSAASSASLMLRKMGKGMKKGGRSIKGLFRPKSVIGVAPADGPVQGSVGQVSMVTVEAEREKVNVNLDPHEQAGGGTGFPKLERNSVDANRASNGQLNGDHHEGVSRDTRQSVLGNDQERSDVLAAVKRGILKRSATDSPGTTVQLPFSDPLANGKPGSPLERKGSPAGSTSSNEVRRSGHRRNDSKTLDNTDYFNTLPRLPGASHSSRSLPETPRSLARNISFSPRIQFYDVWSSTEYDRRGDIATCNRLTPMLAQQIKEELNTFKMEMEVHEQSKPHTHFF